ncbi:MAG: M1 family metallopeptidase [Coriobacteriales bacterium]|jgi:hypothetical protein|nr:M1 family metallopeptidase [Coriobacteriales bacterium]
MISRLAMALFMVASLAGAIGAGVPALFGPGIFPTDPPASERVEITPQPTPDGPDGPNVPATPTEALPTEAPWDASAIKARLDEPATHYTVEASFNEQEHTLAIEQTLNYLNSSSDTLTELWLKALPVVYLDGGFTLHSASLPCRFTGDGSTLVITLPEALAPGARADVSLSFTVTLPERVDRYGWYGSLDNFSSFLAYALVYENGAWQDFTYGPAMEMGDPYYRPIADFDVRLTAPEGCVVAASSIEQSVERSVEPATGAAQATYTYEMRKAREFTFSVSRDYEVTEQRVCGINIRVYSTDEAPGAAEATLDAAARSLDLFSRTFIPYPYDSLSVVLNGLEEGVGGMEFSGLIFVDLESSIEGYARTDVPLDWSDNAPEWDFAKRMALLTVVHEVAHQWFYGIVGGDQINEPWIDEGGATFSEYLYAEKCYTTPVAESGFYIAPMYATTYDNLLEEFAADADEQLGGSIGSFSNYGYRYYVYDVPAALFYGMQECLGPDAFDAALLGFFEEFSFDEVSVEEFATYWRTAAAKTGDELAARELDELFTAFLG